MRSMRPIRFGFHMTPVLPEAVLTVDGHLLKYTSPCSFAPLHFVTGKGPLASPKKQVEILL